MPLEIKRFYEVYIRASSKGQPFTIREVRASNIGQLVKISGIVTRCSDVKPLMKVAVYTCEECGFEIYQEVTARVFMPLLECPSKRCNVNRAKGNLILQLGASKFLKFQEAKLQELAEPVPKGHIPCTMTVHFRGELTRKVSPGDVVELSGIFLPIPYTGFRAMRAGLVADTYLEAMSISHFKKKYEMLCKEGALDPKKVIGKILVCLRGDNPRLDKSTQAAHAGAAGMILCNDKASGSELIADPHILPATNITYDDGRLVYDYLNSTNETMGYITPPKPAVDVKPAPFMAGFSSRGPNTITPEILKPDITAPGVNIIAAYTEDSDGSSPVFKYNIESGTSMSCPHVSGVVGLLKSLHPD